MNTINLKKEGIYRIYFNDENTYIEIDTNDIGTPIKCYESIDKVEKLEKETIDKIKEIIENKEEDANRKIAYIEKEMFTKLREIIDEFLGEGACQKIFGDRNYYSMYNDLFEELSKKRKELGNKSHFDMMGLEAKSINEKLMNKYNKRRENVI